MFSRVWNCVYLVFAADSVPTSRHHGFFDEGVVVSRGAGYNVSKNIFKERDKADLVKQGRSDAGLLLGFVHERHA